MAVRPNAMVLPEGISHRNDIKLKLAYSSRNYHLKIIPCNKVLTVVLYRYHSAYTQVQLVSGDAGGKSEADPPSI